MRDSGLKLSTTSGRSAGIVWWFTQGTGGRSARHLLIQRQISPNLHWTRTLHPYVHCLGHLLYVSIINRLGVLHEIIFNFSYRRWGVSGGFTFGTWLAASGRPILVKNYAALLASWCEWNASSSIDFSIVNL